MRATAVLLVVISLLTGGAGRAAELRWNILNVEAVPYLQAAGRTSYSDFLLMNLPRAMAIASSGAYGWYGGAGTMEDARTKALKSCVEKGGTDCAIYAVDLQVVWQGRPPQALPPIPGPLISTRDYAFAPDDRFFWWGPQAARGVLVWGHGKANGYDGRGQQPPPSMRAFNNGGFDIVRFERAPSADYADDAADWLRNGLATLRSRGWRTVVVGGQSRGAWNSLQVLDTPGLVDAAIAVSPASFESLATQEANLSRILRNIRASTARVAVAQFKGDVYVRDMADRIEMLRTMLQTRVSAALVIDEPDGITGHGGGNSSEFARRFGECLLRFVTQPVAPKECGPRRAS